MKLTRLITLPFLSYTEKQLSEWKDKKSTLGRGGGGDWMTRYSCHLLATKSNNGQVRRRVIGRRWHHSLLPCAAGGTAEGGPLSSVLRWVMVSGGCGSSGRPCQVFPHTQCWQLMWQCKPVFCSHDFGVDGRRRETGAGSSSASCSTHHVRFYGCK